MMLKYLPSKKWIVFDHLIPSQPAKEGFYEFYGPDLSYDGLKYENGSWVFMSNLNLTNDPSISDELFNDPKKLALPQNQPAKKDKKY
ncbi:hypothetical protein D3C72_1761470 [compost metagenome]